MAEIVDDRTAKISGFVTRLYLQYPLQNMDPKLFRYKVGDMVTALLEFEPAAVEIAVIQWWTDPENKWLPHPGALIELCKPAQTRLIQDRAQAKELEHRKDRLTGTGGVEFLRSGPSGVTVLGEKL